MGNSTSRIGELIIGEKVGLIAILKSMSECQNGTYACVLSDKTGTIDATVGAGIDVSSVRNQVNGAVKVSAIVKPGQNRKPTLNIKTISIADKSEYKSSDLFDGLSEEKIAEYTSLIKSLQRHIKHPGYAKLVACALNDITLQKLSQMPASLGFYGTYKGGALAGAALIAEMVKQVGCTYVTHYNGMHQGNIDWSLLLTAALLNTFGVIKYITPESPFQKTPIGMERGYLSVLQSMIEQVIYQNQIELDELAIAKLCNVIGCAMSKRTAVRATSKEGILLRHTVSMYGELDMFDYGSSELTEEEYGENGYFYSKTLNRYVAQ